LKFALIGFFGLVGVFGRFFLDSFATRIFHSNFPFGTFVINLLGSFPIGVVFVLGFEKTLLSSDLKVGIAVGLLGGFTTFSAFSLDVVRLIESSLYIQAFLYLSMSPIMGALAAMGGVALSRFFC